MALDRRDFLTAAGSGAALLVLGPRAQARAGSAALRELGRKVRGPLITPANGAYRAAARIYNARFDGRRPDAVVQPLDAADVRAVVRWAAAHDVALVPRSGGHSYAGQSTTSDGVVVDLSRMRRVHVNRGSSRVTVQGGAQLIDVYAALAAHGGAIPGGSCPSVGVGGLTLGGGMGLASRRLGLACDQLRSVEIVTARAVLRHASARAEKDLFWACRGGGGSFGIATSMTFRVHRARRAAWFSARWPAGQADAALAAWLSLAPSAPNALTSVLALSSGSVTAIGQ